MQGQQHEEAKYMWFHWDVDITLSKADLVSNLMPHFSALVPANKEVLGVHIDNDTIVCTIYMDCLSKFGIDTNHLRHFPNRSANQKRPFRSQW